MWLKIRSKFPCCRTSDWGSSFAKHTQQQQIACVWRKDSPSEINNVFWPNDRRGNYPWRGGQCHSSDSKLFLMTQMSLSISFIITTSWICRTVVCWSHLSKIGVSLTLSECHWHSKNSRQTCLYIVAEILPVHALADYAVACCFWIGKGTAH